MADDTPPLNVRALIDAAADDKAKALFESALYRILISIEQEVKAGRRIAEEALDHTIGLATLMLPDAEDEDAEVEERADDDDLLI